MKIKTKLRLGFGFLFAIVLFFGAVSLFYLNEISLSARVILKDNYETLNFTRAMRDILDNNSLPLSSEASNTFNNHLQLEENNITEAGEREAVLRLKDAFTLLISPASPLIQKEQALKHIRMNLNFIEKLNIDAIVRKNAAAQKSVKKATMYMSFAAAFSFLVLFSFIVNFPGFIANPLNELKAGIKEITHKNYKQHLYFEGNDEFSDIAKAFNEMATRLDEWESTNLATLKSEKLRIEAIIEQMEDAIIGLNENNEILFVNPIAEQVLNLDENNIVGLNALELSQRNNLLKSILELQNARKPLTIYANGKESYFQLESREILIPNLEESNTDNAVIKSGNSAGKVYILKNITQFKELDEAKTNFIATVSHELKTPISSIKMSIKLLKDERVGELNHEQKELVEHIEDDTQRLLKITSELLDLSQVETGNIQLSFMAADPDKIVDYAINAVKFQADQKQIQIECFSVPNLPKVTADIEKTTWVLINFLSNAMRYSSEKGKVTIQIKPSGTMIEFSVKDFGKGIEEQYQKRLFDKYFQVPTDGKNKSGTGLGLAISKDFIEAQSGRIWVESAIGEGSRFCFSLPVAS